MATNPKPPNAARIASSGVRYAVRAAGLDFCIVLIEDYAASHTIKRVLAIQTPIFNTIKTHQPFNPMSSKHDFKHSGLWTGDGEWKRNDQNPKPKHVALKLEVTPLKPAESKP